MFRGLRMCRRVSVMHVRVVCGRRTQTTSALLLFIHPRARCWLWFARQVNCAGLQHECRLQQSAFTPQGQHACALLPAGPRNLGCRSRAWERFRVLIFRFAWKLKAASSSSSSSSSADWASAAEVFPGSGCFHCPVLFSKVALSPHLACNKVVCLQFIQPAGRQHSIDMDHLRLKTLRGKRRIDFCGSYAEHQKHLSVSLPSGCCQLQPAERLRPMAPLSLNL